MSKWAAYVGAVQSIKSSINMTLDWAHTVPAEYVENNSGEVLTFCVTLQPALGAETGIMAVRSLGPGEKMTKFPDVKDVECVVRDDGTRVKISGKIGDLAQKMEVLNDMFCQWAVSRNGDGINEQCEIENRELFVASHPEWGPCFADLPDKTCQIEPYMGADFNRCEIDGPLSGDEMQFLKPIEISGGLFEVGLRSLTHLLIRPNFEGVDDIPWKHPVGYYNKWGYEGPEGYFDNHYLDVNKIQGGEPHGIYQDLNGWSIQGQIRFGVHVKKTGGAEDAEIKIVIWSLNRHQSSEKRYKLPEGIYFDCFTDAEVNLDDKLRFEIYLPDNSSYHLGGAYLLQQMIPGNIVTDNSERTYPAYDPGYPDGPPGGGDW